MALFRKTPDKRHATGREGEAAAARHLARHGYKVLYRNFQPDNGGEIDLVCRHGDVLAFIEVKTRSSDKFGTPYEGLRQSQKHKIILGALEWLRLLHNPDILFRFDVVEVRHYANEWMCTIIENAFTLPPGYRYSPERHWSEQEEPEGR